MLTFFKMNFLTRFFSAIAFLLMMTAVAYGQGQWNSEGELDDVEIEIVKERQITLPKANRNFEQIPPRPVETIKPPIQYDFRPFSFQTTPINPAIRPLKLKTEDQSKVYGGYLSAGYGNYASPYLEGFINSKRDKHKLVGAHGLFSSSDKGPVDGRNSGSGLSQLSVYGKSFSEFVTLSGDAAFENRTTHFFGYPAGTNVEGKDIKQSYNIFRLKGDISNAKASDFNYKLGAGFSYLADKYAATESEVDLDFSSGYKFSETSGLGIRAGYYLINRKDSQVEAKPRNLFFVNPKFEFSPVDKLKLNAGFNVGVENDTIDSKNVHVYPDINASYPLTPSVEVVASLTGGLEKVSLQTLSNENIWVGPNIDIFHTNKLYDLQGAIRTKIANKVAVNGGFSVASLKNWYFFVNDLTDQSKFKTEYDKGSVMRSNFFASIGFASAENANILVRGDLYSYQRDNREVWHRPTYKLTADASFNIVKKILLKLNVITQGGMLAQDPHTVHSMNPLPVTIKLNPALDVNVRTDYMLSDSFTIFVQLNNITSNKYPLFLYYPVRGFQGMGGITWNF
jgi:hypothetical protein